MKKVIIVVGIILILAGLMFYKLKSNQEKVEQNIYKADPNKEVLVRTSTISRQIIGSAKSYLGTFEASRENKIASEVAGKVVVVGVQEGQYIKKGHLIAKVDEEMIGLQIESLKISLEGQQKDVARYTNLSNSDASPAINLEKAQLAVKMTQAQIRQLEAQAKRTAIYSPFSGIVTMRMFDAGSVLAPGVPLIQLTDISSLKLSVAVPENDLVKFRMGQSATIKTEVYPLDNFRGTVSEIATKGDASHNFAVKLLVNNSSKSVLRAGMYGSIENSNSTSSTLACIPKTALVGSPKDAKVFVIVDGRAKLKSIQVGISDNTNIEVKSGIADDEQVVTVGQLNLVDGAKVKIEN
ncbi:MAG: efflux RND transporter periplasmic adaptor subunit [Leadbetterella sp.]